MYELIESYSAIHGEKKSATASVDKGFNAFMALSEQALYDFLVYQVLECLGAVASQSTGEAEALDTIISLNRCKSSAADIQLRKFVDAQRCSTFSVACELLDLQCVGGL